MAIETPSVRSSVTASNVKTSTSRLPMIARILLGVIWTFFGIFGLLMAFHIAPAPKQPMPEAATAFSAALGSTGYMMPLCGVVELVVGLLLLSNRFVPLALTLVAPIVVNIIFFHVFLAPAGIRPGAVVAALEIYLAWAYRDSFRTVLAPRSVPA